MSVRRTLAIQKTVIYSVLSCCLAFAGIAQPASAACPAQAADKGVVTFTADIPVTGTYRFWSRKLFWV